MREWTNTITLAKANIGTSMSLPNIANFEEAVDHLHVTSGKKYIFWSQL